MNTKLSLVVATLHQPDWRRCVDSWHHRSSGGFNCFIVEDKELMQAYQIGLEATSAEIVGFVHDDVIVTEQGWDERVMREFDDPQVGLVGFGGATGFGDPQMYLKPYELIQLARKGFRSNMANAEVHGERFAGSCDVSVLDGFAMFARRELLENAGGWPQDIPIKYFMYDAWLCCEALRHCWTIRMAGVGCDHLGGKSTGMGKEGQFQFEEAHRWIYEHCADVLPAEVEK